MGVKCLGIIGGYEYNATIELQYYINEEINKNIDTRNYIKTFVINDAVVNSDEDTYDNNTNTNSKRIIEMSVYKAYNNLIELGCNIIAIPCNTYSNLLLNNTILQSDIKILQSDIKIIQSDTKIIQSDIKILQSDIKIINCVDATINWINSNLPMVKKIGLIDKQEAISSRLYQDRLINYDIVSFNELKYDISSIIVCHHNREPSKDFKLNNKSLVEKMNRIIDTFVKNGINHIILGCPELSLFIKYNRRNLNSVVFIDTLEILAKNIVNN